jgi:hypothetical protein
MKSLSFLLLGSLLTVNAANASLFPGMRCDLSLLSLSNEGKVIDLEYNKIEFDLSENGPEEVTKTHKALVNGQEVFFSLKMVSAGNENTLMLGVYDNHAAGEARQIANIFDNRIGGTQVTFSKDYVSEAQAYLEVKIPNVTSTMAAIVCSGY